MLTLSANLKIDNIVEACEIALANYKVDCENSWFKQGDVGKERAKNFQTLADSLSGLQPNDAFLVIYEFYNEEIHKRRWGIFPSWSQRLLSNIEEALFALANIQVVIPFTRKPGASLFQEFSSQEQCDKAPYPTKSWFSKKENCFKTDIFGARAALNNLAQQIKLDIVGDNDGIPLQRTTNNNQRIYQNT